MIRRLSAVLSALLLLLCAATVLLWVLAYWGQYVVQVVILRPQPGNAAWQNVLDKQETLYQVESVRPGFLFRYFEGPMKAESMERAGDVPSRDRRSCESSGPASQPPRWPIPWRVCVKLPSSYTVNATRHIGRSKWIARRAGPMQPRTRRASQVLLPQSGINPRPTSPTPLRRTSTPRLGGDDPSFTCQTAATFNRLGCSVPAGPTDLGQIL
ncbi:MAG: hypothetical protein JWN51_3797 [Phycisphaerales bacterium]|nr:hypothetical protein [Phycisphaerales bacterium]